jgi:multidrug efflux system membrane fusion protein
VSVAISEFIDFIKVAQLYGLLALWRVRCFVFFSSQSGSHRQNAKEMAQDSMNQTKGDALMNSQLVRPPRLSRQWGVILMTIFSATLALLWFQRVVIGHPTQANSAPAPALSIGTAAAKKGDISVYLNALGTVTPVYTVTITSRVSGQIMSVNYREGQMVRKGAPLLEIDPKPYEAQVTAQEGQLAHDQALLSEARVDLERYKAAYSRNAIAKQQLDDQEQVVRQYEGSVKNDEGNLQSAKVNLAYCHITSPIDGRVGLRLVDPGNLAVTNSSTPLVVVTQIRPITVVFSVAEDYLPQIQQQLRQGHRMTVDALDRAQEKKIATGSLLTLDNQIDTGTGTIKLKAIFPNQDDSLFPNQFVNAKLLVDTHPRALLIPASAIQRNAQGAFVYVVGPDQTLALRSITVGTVDNNVAEVQGLQSAEIIATDNFDKLRDGLKVVSENASAHTQTGAGR